MAIKNDNIQRTLGKIEKSLETVERDIKEIKKDVKDLPVIKRQLENHLKHHRITSDRLFYIMLAVFTAILGWFGWLLRH